MRFLLFLLLFLSPICDLSAKSSVEAVRFTDIPYVKDGGKRQQLDIVLPHDYQTRDKLPVIVYIHGGGWNKGDKAGFSKNPAMLQSGYACVSINYRYLKQAFFPAQVEDCKAAIRWLRAHATDYNIDPDRIGVFGTSAGGHLAAMLGVTGDAKQFDIGDCLDQSSAVQAVCNAFGPSDLSFYAEHSQLLAARDQSLAEVIQKNQDRLKEGMAQVSPILFLKEEKPYPPFLILHGDQDLVVPIALSYQFEKKMKSVGGDIELSVAKGVGHGSGVLSSNGHFGKMRDFFNKNLKQTK